MSATADRDRLTTSEHLSRRQLLKGAAGLAALGGAGFAGSRLLAAGGPTGPRLVALDSGHTQPVRAFHSRPDLHPPSVSIGGRRGAPGFLLMSPSAQETSSGSQAGPLLVDHRGEPVWFSPLSGGQTAANVRIQSFQGEPVLTWWEGQVTSGYGQGEAVILDRSYRELARVRAANGLQMDLHEFLLTAEGTALFTCYPKTVEADLSSIGGSRQQGVLEPVIQEVDVRSGRLVFEWRPIDHVSPAESYLGLGDPYDYLHANSIAVTQDGNLLVSARHTWTLYKIDRRTGEVIWRLGGKRGDYRLTNGAEFAWQHNATQLADNELTLFDDGSDGSTNTEKQSRGIRLMFDEIRRTARLGRAYTHPKVLTTAMGSMQVLPDGHVVVGWGTEPYTSEYTADGRLVQDARLPGQLNSYRGFRFPWHARPAEAPAVAVPRERGSASKTVYASWNGATHVHYWQVHLGTSPRGMRPIGVATRRGFETAIPLDATERYVAVSALAADGTRLGTSQTLRA
jgi:hypothetical protein